MASFAAPAMATAARIRSLSRHSSASLERLSFICCTTLRPLPRLGALADALLLERQLANPPSCPAWIRPEEVPY
jgi:hypothetical protein